MEGPNVHDLTFIRRLGVGARGTVWLATASGASPADAPMQLAVKVQPLCFYYQK